MEDIGLWSKPGASQATRAYNRNSICLKAHGNMHGSVSSPQDEGWSFPNELQSEAPELSVHASQDHVWQSLNHHTDQFIPLVVPVQIVNAPLPVAVPWCPWPSPSVRGTFISESWWWVGKKGSWGLRIQVLQLYFKGLLSNPNLCAVVFLCLVRGCSK